jgi:hypothetical protein
MTQLYTVYGKLTSNSMVTFQEKGTPRWQVQDKICSMSHGGSAQENCNGHHKKQWPLPETMQKMGSEWGCEMAQPCWKTVWPVVFCCCCCCFLVVLEFELRALHLPGRSSPTYCLTSFSNRVFYLCLDCHPIYTSYVAGTASACHHIQPWLTKMGSHTHFA